MWSKKIRILLVMSEISLADLARALGISPQNLSIRMRRNNWRADELAKIAEITGSEFVCEFHTKDGKIV
jgi:DNA-binding Xre family transcriptional regulator